MSTMANGLKSMGQPVVTQQASGFQRILIVIEDKRVDIEGYGILLAANLRRLEIRRAEFGGLDAGGV